jgi:hypothetical protein
MLQHRQESEPASSRSLPAKADFASTQIETYLDRISPPVEGTLTEEARQERRAEMKTHFESLIAAYIELGDTPEQAIAKAFQQFGNSRSVQQEWKRVTADDSRQSLRTACALYGVTFCLFVLAMNSNIMNHMGLVPFLLFLGLWSVPAGFGTGLLARSHPMRSAFTMQKLLSVPVLILNVHWLLWPKAVEVLQDKGIMPSFASVCREILDDYSGQHILLLALGVIVLTGACGILAGSLSAGIGGWLRKQNLRLRRRLALR